MDERHYGSRSLCRVYQKEKEHESKGTVRCLPTAERNEKSLSCALPNVGGHHGLSLCQRAEFCARVLARILLPSHSQSTRAPTLNGGPCGHSLAGHHPSCQNRRCGHGCLSCGLLDHPHLHWLHHPCPHDFLLRENHH